ncbi:hypothetical protein CHU33_05770 [Superficieibacter electus]|uniref:DUF218 domain-containing protein n=1 Tax=Superficieibacter electus TaxID=2022662 RepID=A0ABX4ZGK7_9ENTR|nr:hypothetical protein [Superficieibacter electus]POP46266.1 hypothetical protein CHU33_05770 [Superficieibacter electus]
MSAQKKTVWGITGHRRIPHPEKLLQTLLRQGELLYTSGTLVDGLTPLAEGADRIFAQALIQLGIPYSVPLPLEQKNYEQDFPDTIREFHTLLEKAHTVFTLPRCPWLTDSEVQPMTSGRDFQYLSVGVYIANQSDVLFSAWNGKPALGMGGTAQITQLFQDFDSLKASVNEEQYHYFQKLGNRKITTQRKLISLDIAQEK